jgi:hypothetical protein
MRVFGYENRPCARPGPFFFFFSSSRCSYALLRYQSMVLSLFLGSIEALAACIKGFLLSGRFRFRFNYN